jgi:hypothetical protein
MLIEIDVVAICAGRTLLPKTNGWREALAPIAESDPCVKHALLALSAGYVLDFNPNDALRNRCNFHFRRTCDLLNKKITDPRYRAVGKDDADALIAAFRILWCDDVSCDFLRIDTILMIADCAVGTSRPERPHASMVAGHQRSKNYHGGDRPRTSLLPSQKHPMLNSSNVKCQHDCICRHSLLGCVSTEHQRDGKLPPLAFARQSRKHQTRIWRNRPESEATSHLGSDYPSLCQIRKRPAISDASNWCTKDWRQTDQLFTMVRAVKGTCYYREVVSLNYARTRRLGTHEC